MDPSDWIPLPPSLFLWLLTEPSRDLKAWLLFWGKHLSLLPHHMAAVDVLSRATVLLTCGLLRKGQTKWIMKAMWLGGGEALVLYLLKPPLGAAQRLWKKMFSSSADKYGSGGPCIVQSMIFPHGYTSCINSPPVKNLRWISKWNCFLFQKEKSFPSPSIFLVLLSEKWGFYGCIYFQKPPEARVIAHMDVHTVTESSGPRAAR